MRAKLILWKHHKNKRQNGYNIKIQIENSGTTYKQTNYYVALNQWRPGKLDEDGDWKEGAVINHPEAKEINAAIRKELQEIKDNYSVSGVAETGNQKDFYWWVDRFITNKKPEVGSKHIEKLEDAKKKILGFRKNIPVSSINTIWVNDFRAHLLKLKKKNGEPLSPNYVSMILEITRSFTQELIDEDFIKKDPWRKIKIQKVLVEKTRLTREEVEKLKALPLAGGNQNQILARDMFLFSLYCFGIRFGDMARLTYSMIKDGHLEYTMGKSKKNKQPTKRRIKLNESALEIIKRQNTIGYIFNTRVNQKNEHKTVKSSNSNLNKALRKVCRKAGITEVSFHKSRHTFTDWAIQSGADIYQIKEALGHLHLQTTQIYSKQFYPEKTEGVSEKVFGK